MCCNCVFDFMFLLCSTYVLTVLDLCFDCARLVSTVLVDLCFDCARFMFRPCSTYVLTFSIKTGYVLTSSTYFSILSIYVSTFSTMSDVFRLCARLKIASRPQNVSRKTALSRLSKSKHKSSTSTRVYRWGGGGFVTLNRYPGDTVEEIRHVEIHRNQLAIMSFFSVHYAEFRSRIPFRTDIWRDAEIIYQSLKEANNCSKLTNCTSVYVHMRMGDYPQYLRGKHVYAPEVFQQTNYMQEAFKNVSNTYQVRIKNQ